MLVIIGLIVGGVLVGRDLISASEIRAQISQIEKLNTAVNTFRGKFNALPGDISVSNATQFGFANASCAGTAGLRDGNGVIEGNGGSGSKSQGGGETGLFWNDLSSEVGGRLIDAAFTTATCTSTPSVIDLSGLKDYFLPAKITSVDYILVYSHSGSNYFNLSSLGEFGGGIFTGYGKTPIIKAYKIDAKMDDGIPNAGNVKAEFVNGDAVNTTSWPTYQSWACDNSTTNTYNITNDGGNAPNCTLTFKLQ